MPTWNKDISKAPRGTTKIVTKGKIKQVLPVRDWVMTYSKCDQLIYTYYIAEEERWNLYGKGEQPLAWMEINKPDV